VCGISGAGFPAGRVKPQRLVQDILESQHDRGPDWTAQQEVTGTRLASIIGHNRLSILDLSQAANQPMWNSAGTRCLTYNGEIYNYVELRQELRDRGHTFGTQSDSEVLLAAYDEWGIDAITRFNGPFAFAILEVESNQIVLARDRFGVKPLFFVLRDELFAFASTAKVLAKFWSLEPDLAYVAAGLRYGVYDDALTAPFHGMNVVPPGTALIVSVDEADRITVKQHAYYCAEERVAALVESMATRPSRLAHEDLTEILENAVRIRLRSDVPVAVSLSGGLDSSSIAAIARSMIVDQVTGFTFGAARDASSEGPVVENFGRDVGLEVQYVWPSTSEIVEAYSATLDAQGAPFVSGSVMAQYLLYRCVNKHGVKVLLGGQGGDEIFMGYRKFYPLHLRDLAAQGKFTSAFRFLFPTAQMLLAEADQAKMYWAELYRYRSQGVSLPALALPPASPMVLGFEPSERLWHRQLRDVTAVSLPTLLRYEDRNSMANSVESRLPFLDYRLVELAIALPTASKLRNGYGKWVLRQITADRVPRSVRLTRRKVGFSVRQNGWVDLGLGIEIRRLLNEQSTQLSNWLRPGTLVDEVFSDGRLKSDSRAFGEATALLWLAQVS